ncbi:MAG: hypothetical protein R3C11_12345 [Planctomycetaceae bacterium]
MQKVTIRCADLAMQKAVLFRNGSVSKEGTLRRNENLYGTWVDHDVYGLLLDETPTQN